MSTKHTPGPWVAIFPESRYFHEGTDITSFEVMSEKTRAQFRAEGLEHYDKRDEDVANVEIVSCQFWRDKTDEEAKANARLIAAAPELLESLQSLAAQHSEADLRADPDLHAAVKRARAAISKATGSAS